MNTEDGKLIEEKGSLDTLIVIGRLLNELQHNYGQNDFCPATICLDKNGDTIFARVKDSDGNGEIILHRWKLEEFKNDIIY